VNLFRELQVAFRRQCRKEIESLEDETNLPSPDIRALGIRDGSQILAVNDHPTRGRLEQSSENMKQTRLATSGRTHYRDKLPRRNSEIHPAQGVHIHLANVVGHLQVFSEKNRGHASSQSLTA
jgi:hypothetical protein